MSARRQEECKPQGHGMESICQISGHFWTCWHRVCGRFIQQKVQLIDHWDALTSHEHTRTGIGKLVRTSHIINSPRGTVLTCPYNIDRSRITGKPGLDGLSCLWNLSRRGSFFENGILGGKCPRSWARTSESSVIHNDLCCMTVAMSPM